MHTSVSQEACRELADSYTTLPYEGHPHYATHPDCIATLATLMGMQPPPVESCRVLELGCSTGGNLLAMAVMLPEARFEGIDLVPAQIEQGREAIRSIGLNNVRLRAMNLLDVPEDLGTFDYILCHGVFSWVPAEVQEKILSICQHHLADNGVAYISYNVLPGWHYRAPLRDLLRYHLRDAANMEERIARARELLQVVSQQEFGSDQYPRQILKHEARELLDEPDYYLVHEHLDPVSEPMYFHQFLERAGRYGLQFLGESWYHSQLDRLPPPLQEAIRAWSGSLVEREQYTDHFNPASFRRTLLCRDRIPLDRQPSVERMAGMYATGIARPVSEQPDIGSAAPESFAVSGEAVTTNMPLAKAMLAILWEAAPEPLALEDLWQRIGRRLGELGVTLPPEQDRATLAGAVLKCYLSTKLVLHVHPPRFATAPGPIPEASPLARYQARSGRMVTNLLHQRIVLDEPARLLVPLLDGQLDRTALLRAWQERGGGETKVEVDGQSVPLGSLDSATGPKVLERYLERAAGYGLLLR